MFNRISLIILVFLVWRFSVTTAQEKADTALILPVLEIAGTKIRSQSTGSSAQAWNLTDLAQLPVNNAAELLAAETGTFIKSYGLGSLATSSVRGGSAGHTLVLWNGLPIQSPMLGQLDLALLPLNSVESINFQRGGNAALWGSGAIGGVLSLSNEADFDNRLSLNSQTLLGDFGRFQQQLKLQAGTSKWQSVSRFSYQEAANDFYYTPAPGLPEKRQSNARLFQHYLLQDIYLKLGNNKQLAAHFWHQQSDREIPPTNVQNRSDAYQIDRANRLILHYRQIAKRMVWQMKAGVFDEHLNYFDDQILLESRSHFRSYLAEVTGQWSWKDHYQILAGNTYIYTEASSAGYESVPSENKTALFLSWRYQRDNFQSQLSLRQEIVDDNRVPLVPEWGFHYRFTQRLDLKGKISKNYRLPTFNDRYWQVGGNPDLLPESGWSQELTLENQWSGKDFKCSLSATVFNRHIDDWILWSIKEGDNFFSANNITKVWSRGLEPRFSLSYQWKDFQITWRSGYDHIRSTNQVDLAAPQMNAGEQLIYTPIHQAFSTFSLDWKSWHLAYQHRYTGTIDGINEPVAAFQIGNIRLQYTIDKSSYRGTIFLNSNNIWNTDYMVVERRPMPGTNYQIGLNIYVNKKQKR